MIPNRIWLTVAIACVATLASVRPCAAQKGPSFREVTGRCGLKGQGGDRFCFGDYDGDGDPDMLVDASRLYRNDSRPGKIRFTDVTAAAGLEGAGGGGACWFDFNRDGQLDFLTNSGQVWIGDGEGGFADLGPKLGLEVPNETASCIGCGDLNGDGWIDLFTGGGELWNPYRLVRQTIWLNVKGRKFEDVTAQAGLREQQYGRSVIWCDYDWDGDGDVYSGNYRLRPNSLLRNDGGSFEEVAATAGVTGRHDQTMFTHPRTGEKCGYRYGHTIAASWADLNNDGLFDLWVSNLAHKAIGKVDPDFAKKLGSDYDDRGFYCDDSNVFINQGPPEWNFVDMRQELGIPIVPIEEYGQWRGDELWSNAACGDADNNGWVDVYVNQVYGNQPNSHALLFMNQGGSFTERHRDMPVRLWGGYGAAWADLDSDGRLELVAGGTPQCGGKASMHVFHNRTRGGSWIGFVVKGTKRVQAIGAKLLLVQKKLVQVRQVETTMGSHTQQNDTRIHFGLGRGGAILDVVVYWPGGPIQSLGTPRPRKYHVVELKKTSAPRIGRVTPATAQVGAEAEFRVSGGPSEAKYYWSFEGTRRCDAVTDAPEARHTYAREGDYVCLVRVIKEDGGAIERTFEVTAE